MSELSWFDEHFESFCFSCMLWFALSESIFSKSDSMSIFFFIGLTVDQFCWPPTMPSVNVLVMFNSSCFLFSRSICQHQVNITMTFLPHSNTIQDILHFAETWQRYDSVLINKNSPLQSLLYCQYAVTFSSNTFSVLSVFTEWSFHPWLEHMQPTCNINLNQALQQSGW